MSLFDPGALEPFLKSDEYLWTLAVVQMVEDRKEKLPQPQVKPVGRRSRLEEFEIFIG